MRESLPDEGQNVPFVSLLGGPASPGAGRDKPKPRCNAQTRGMFWPDEANSNPRLAQFYADRVSWRCAASDLAPPVEPVTVHVANWSQATEGAPLRT